MDQEVNMETYMTLEEASAILQVTPNVLKTLANNGNIRTTMLTNGILLLNEQDVKSRMPLHNRPEYRKYIHLADNPISLSEADRRYGINNATLSRWLARGYIARLGQAGRQVLVDEAEIAAYAEIYKSKHGRQGVWMFDKSGSVYVKKCS
jgi:predicted site-specific integrase-resolvase